MPKLVQRLPKERTFYRKVNVSLVFCLTLNAESGVEATEKAGDLVYEHLQVSMPDLPSIKDWEFRLSTGRAYPYFPEQECP